MNSPCLITPKIWSYTCLYDCWLSDYCRVRLWKAAILDLSKMADIGGAQLGSLEKVYNFCAVAVGQARARVCVCSLSLDSLES